MKLPPGHITRTEAAKILGITKRSVSQRCCKGTLNGMKILNERGKYEWVVRKSSLDPKYRQVEAKKSERPGLLELEVYKPKRGQPGQPVLPPILDWLV